jgi:hypothetical protein
LIPLQRWLITGDHTGYVTYEFVRNNLDDLAYNIARGIEDEYGNWLPSVSICHGMADGVDTHADTWAVVNWCPVVGYKADWDKYHKAAGGIRNQLMLDEFKPQLVIAFPGPNSKGTWDMVRRAGKAGVETRIFKYVAPIESVSS